jgi:hypothetical protein
MPETEPRLPSAGTSPPVDRIVSHLLHKPFDLLDTSRLMRRFRASAAEVQSALARVERLRRDQAKQEVAPAQDYSEGVEKLVLHLLRHPYDILDTRRLLRRFRVSAQELQSALDRLANLVMEKEGLG